MQELLLLLDEYWERNPEIRGVPIYQASSLAKRAMSIYQTYIEMMNEDIRAAFHVRRDENLRTVLCMWKQYRMTLQCMEHQYLRAVLVKDPDTRGHGISINGEAVQ
jgi:Cft2 family RNA processing exonuclease